MNALTLPQIPHDTHASDEKNKSYYSTKQDKNTTLPQQLALLRLKMGSVGHNYRRPICGRTGNGGYAFDHVGYPTCSICNFRHDGFAYGALPEELVFKQLIVIAGNADSPFRNILRIDLIKILLISFMLPE